jgi:WD40 repeat protein
MSAKDQIKAQYETEIDSYYNDLDGLCDARSGSNLLSSTNTTGVEQPPSLKRNGLIKNQSKVADSTWLDKDNCLLGLADGNLAGYNVQTGTCCYFTTLGMDGQSYWIRVVERNQFTSGNDMLVAAGGMDNNVTVMKVPMDDLTGPTPNPDSSCPTAEDRKKNDKLFSKHGGAINSIRWLTKDKLVSGSGDKTCMLWDMTEGGGIVKIPVQTLKGFTKDVNDIAVLSENEILTGSGNFCRLHDMRVNTGSGVVATFAGHQEEVTKLRAIGDTRCFVSGSEDKTLRVWDSRSMSSVQTCEGSSSGITAVCLTASGRHAYAGTSGAGLDASDILTGDKLELKIGCKGTCGMEKDELTAKMSSLELNPDNYSILATAHTEDKNISLFTPEL